MPTDAKAVADADEVDPRFMLAKRQLDAGRFPDAEMILRSMLIERPQLVRGEFLLAVAMHKQKRYSEAEPLYDKIIDAKASFPEVNHVFHFLGWCEYYLGRMPEARAAFEEHLRRVKDEPDSIFGLSLVAIEEDRVEEAERLLRRAIELQEGNPKAKRDLAKAHTRLGDLLVRRDDVAGAEEEFRRAVTMWPNHYEAWAKLARSLDRQGKSVQAERARVEERAAMERSGRAGPAQPSGGQQPQEPPTLVEPSGTAPTGAPPPAAAPPVADPKGTAPAAPPVGGGS